MDINLAFRPKGATHAGTEDGHGSWYKKNDAGDWMFIDMAEDGLADRQWDCCGIGAAPGYELIELPVEQRTADPMPKVVRDEGGPAFPATEANYHNENMRGEGMSMRDYFAAKALQGTLASPQIKGNSDLDSWRHADFAQFAYSLADAMLAARSA